MNQPPADVNTNQLKDFHHLGRNFLIVKCARVRNTNKFLNRADALVMFDDQLDAMEKQLVSYKSNGERKSQAVHSTVDDLTNLLRHVQCSSQPVSDGDLLFYVNSSETHRFVFKRQSVQNLMHSINNRLNWGGFNGLVNGENVNILWEDEIHMFQLEIDFTVAMFTHQLMVQSLSIVKSRFAVELTEPGQLVMDSCTKMEIILCVECIAICRKA